MEEMKTVILMSLLMSGVKSKGMAISSILNNKIKKRSKEKTCVINREKSLINKCKIEEILLPKDYRKRMKWTRKS